MPDNVKRNDVLIPGGAKNSEEVTHVVETVEVQAFERRPGGCDDIQLAIVGVKEWKDG